MSHIATLLLPLLLLLLTLPDPSAAIYDYLIVGGGTSGLLLSTLLTTNPSTTVAVLEAGPDGRADPRITVPENEGTAVGTVYDWNFTSTPQSHLPRTAAIAYPRGRVLGGSAALNFMISDRASAAEFDDAWAGVLNVSRGGGWDWTAMEAAFKAVEDFTAPSAALQGAGLVYDAADHGCAGPIAQTMSRNVYSLWSEYVVPALETLGVAALADGDGGVTMGVRYAPLAVNASSYTRSYSGTAYTKVEERANLLVLTNTTATRILWSGSSALNGLAVASAVEYIDPSTGRLAVLNASTIVLSAGAIQSPPFLEASGVGDPAILTALNIPVVVDLPQVGTQFQDHLAHAGSFSFNTTLNLTGGEYIQSLQDNAQPSRFLSAADYAFATDLLFDNSTDDDDDDDDDDSSITGASRASLAMLRALWTADEPVVGFTWFLGFLTGYVLHPLSSGTVHLAAGATAATAATAAAAAAAATATATPPLLIDPNFNGAVINGTAFDLWLLAKALHYYATTVASAGPLGAVGAEYSVSGHLAFEDFQAQIWEGLSSGSHPTGGCAMMPREQGGVVDGDLRVYGTANVRVVDASVVPASPGQHTMGLAYAIAMRAAGILQAG
ncbi:unnamed protein product [Discula destructiva]